MPQDQIFAEDFAVRGPIDSHRQPQAEDTVKRGAKPTSFEKRENLLPMLCISGALSLLISGVLGSVPIECYITR